MKKTLMLMGFALIFSLLVMVQGCGKDKGASFKELILGTWSFNQSKVYTGMIIKAEGIWSSDIKMEGLTSKIIEKKGAASGTWQVEGKQLVLTVVESDMEDVWEKNKTLFCEIVELNNNLMNLKYPDGKVQSWTRVKVPVKGAGKDQELVELPRVIKMEPLVVNLNKIRSHDKDRYLCLDLTLNLKDSPSGKAIPLLHPRARDAMVLFLSSLLYEDVKTLDGVKQVTKNMEVMLDPYLDHMLDNIEINHVIISSTMDKVDEFLIEHAPKPVAEVPADKKK